MIIGRFINALVAFAAILTVGAAHADSLFPVPAMTLYPGDIIRDASLVDTLSSVPADAAIADRAQLIGKAARRTLLAGKPIPAGALDEPRLVTNGGAVRLLFDEPGLTIATTGQALQPGTHGEFIRVRNTESGVIVTGVVQRDGSVKVGG